MTITVDCGFYSSDQKSEAWVSKNGKDRLVVICHPGYQYYDMIKQIFRERGFEVTFR